MRTRGGVRRFQTGGANTPQNTWTPSQLQPVGNPNSPWPAANFPGNPNNPAGISSAFSPQQLAALSAVAAQNQGGANQMGPLPGAAPNVGLMGGSGAPGATPGWGVGAGVGPQLQAALAAQQARGMGAPAMGGVPGAAGGAGMGGAVGAPGGAGANPAMQAAMLNQLRSAGQAPAIGGVNPINPAGAVGGAAFMPRGAGMPGPGAQNAAAMGAPGLNPQAIQQAVLARQGGMGGAALGGFKRGGKVKVKLSSGGRSPGNPADGGSSAMSDTQFRQSGSFKKNAESKCPPGLAKGGMNPGDGGSSALSDTQFKRSGSPKAAGAEGKCPPGLARGGGVPRGSGRGAVAAPNDRNTNLNPKMHGARQWGDTMRPAEDVPEVPSRLAKGVVRRRPAPASTPSPYDYEGPDNTPVMARGGKCDDKMAKGGKWIQGAIKHPGALHAQLGVPQGEKIPLKKLAKAATAGGKLGQRARLAEKLKGFRKRKGGACVEDKDQDKMAAGGAAKQRKGFPKTIPPPKKLAAGGAMKVRGAGIAQRGTQFKGIF